MLTGESTQKRMKSALASWLLADVDAPEGLVLWDDVGWKKLGTEVHCAWGQSHFGMVERDR